MSSVVGQGVSGMAFARSSGAKGHASQDTHISGKNSFEALVGSTATTPSRETGQQAAKPERGDPARTGNGPSEPEKAPHQQPAEYPDDGKLVAAEEPATQTSVSPVPALASWAFEPSHKQQVRAEAKSAKDENDDGHARKSPASTGADSLSLTMLLHGLPKTVATAKDTTNAGAGNPQPAMRGAASTASPADNGNRVGVAAQHSNHNAVASASTASSKASPIGRSQKLEIGATQVSTHLTSHHGDADSVAASPGQARQFDDGRQPGDVRQSDNVRQFNDGRDGKVSAPPPDRGLSPITRSSASGTAIPTHIADQKDAGKPAFAQQTPKDAASGTAAPDNRQNADKPATLAQAAAASDLPRIPTRTDAKAGGPVARASAQARAAETAKPVDTGGEKPAAPANVHDGKPVIPAHEATERPAAATAVAASTDDGRSAASTRAPNQAKAAAIESTADTHDSDAGTPVRATVIAQQNFPAPVHPAGQTAATVLNAIAGDDGWRQAASVPGSPDTQASTVAVPAQTLKIDLHPADLGTVTANLRLVGEQLTIELKPTTHEAYHRLSSDSDTIVKSLRSLGFDVDTVTVMQPSVAPHGAARADAQGVATQSGGQNQSSFQAGGSGGRGNAPGDQQPGRDRGNDGQASNQRHPQQRESVDGSLFI